MTNRFHTIGCALLFLAIVAVSSPDARGCAAVWDTSKGGVQIVSESALIVWDAKAKKQHFIRRASFDARVPYFGFLVPTPTPPDLAESPDDLFTKLEDWTKPDVVDKVRYHDVSIFPFGCPGAVAPGRSADANTPGAAVQVLDTVHVAGFKAVILKADDAEALRKWLEEHGYDARPQLTKWLEPYVKAAWVITAFQIEKGEQKRDSLTPQAVRMSFTTDRPFYPYHEPAEQVKANTYRPRLLRVFFVSDGRMRASFDGSENVWPVATNRPAWAGALDSPRREEIAKQLGSAMFAPPEGAWLTVFDDHAPSRAGKPDVYFSLDRDQAEVRRPPIINERVVRRTPVDEIVGLVGFLCLVIVSPLFLGWISRRARRRAV